jgi:hypothetical protein
LIPSTLIGSGDDENWSPCQQLPTGVHPNSLHGKYLRSSLVSGRGKAFNLFVG